MPSRRSVWRALLMTCSLIVGATVLAACGSSEAVPMSTLDPHGTHAQNILDLLTPVFWAAVFVFVVVEGLLVYSIWRFRSRKNDGIPKQIHGNTTVEIVWTIAPALIVLVIAVLTFRTQAINSRFSADALRVNAVGQQWWFSFDYPDQGITTANEMYIPVGRDITVQLDGRDVLHNFWIPKLAGKTYMIPGNTNFITFRAETPGVYRGQCAEFCGEAHALMKFRVIAVEQAVFDQWVAAQQQIPAAPSSAAAQVTGNSMQEPGQYVPEMPVLPSGAFTGDPQGGNAENGLQVFNSKGCIGCHAIAGNPRAVGKVGPNLSYFGSRTTLGAGLLPNSPEDLYAWLYDPGTIKPGNLMAAQIKPGYLTDQEIKDLIAYLDGQKIDIQLPELR